MKGEAFFSNRPYETDLHRPCLEEKCQRLYADYRGRVISIVAGSLQRDSSDLFSAAAIRHETFMRLKRFEHQEETKVSRA